MFAPSPCRRTCRGPGAFGFGDTPLPILLAQETTDLPGSWGTLLTVRLGLGPRWDRHARPYSVPTRSPLVSRTRTPDEKTFEARCPGFLSDCLRFVTTVARHHARLASGCWPALPGGIRTRRVPMKGFVDAIVTSLPPFPGFAWRNDTFDFPTPLPIQAGRACLNRATDCRNCSGVIRENDPRSMIVAPSCSAAQRPARLDVAARPRSGLAAATGAGRAGRQESAIAAASGKAGILDRQRSSLRHLPRRRSLMEPRHVRLYHEGSGAWHAQNNKTANRLWVKVPQITATDRCSFQIGEQRFRLTARG